MDFLAPVLPTTIVFAVAKKKWVKTIVAIIWFLGCVASGVNALIYLIATAIWLPIVTIITWLIRRRI